MKRLTLAFTLMTIANAAHARSPLVRVPFVGCPSDGQLGPQPRPRSGVTPKLGASEARQLSYYVAPEVADGLGVLAPSGWHCIALYGSNGSQLIVTPEKHRADDFMKSDPVRLRASAVTISVNYGGTSGRWGVAAAIARFFPEHRSSIGKNFEGLELGPLPAGHDPNDVIRDRTDRLVRFTTLAGRKGWGTRWLLQPNARPVEGIVRLVPSDGWFDSFEMEVRLPSKVATLATTILAEPTPKR